MVAEVYYPRLDSSPDRDMADSMFQSRRDCDEDREYMSQTYGRIISFAVTGEDDNEDLPRDRNECENLWVIKISVSLLGSNICASIRRP